MSTATYHRGTGRRKCAIAQVKLSSGSGSIVINGKPYQELFTLVDHRRMIEQPFIVTDTMGKYSVEVKVVGGGMTGQAGAIKHGITKALLLHDPELRGVLKKAGFITRDSRVKERKKYGKKAARARFQFSKR
jgi:small subunit ribosomal protein S9